MHIVINLELTRLFFPWFRMLESTHDVDHKPQRVTSRTLDEKPGSYSTYILLVTFSVQWQQLIRHASLTFKKINTSNGGRAFYQTKYPACRLLWCTLYCVTKSTQPHLKGREACVIVGPRKLKFDPRSCASPFWISGISFFAIVHVYHCWATSSFLFPLSWSAPKARLCARQEQLRKVFALANHDFDIDQKKKWDQGLQLVGWCHGLESPRRNFRLQRNQHKNTE